MSKDELISKAGPARTFSDDESVVLLKDALAVDTVRSDALSKVKAELAAVLVRLEQIA